MTIMKTQLRNTAWGLVVVITAVVSSNSLFAAPGLSLKPWLRPNVPPSVTNPHTPRLGIMGHFRAGRGMVVNSVNPKTFAARIGLERGDVIVRINDRQINSERVYDESLWTAVRFLDGYVDLVILDGRTGRTTHRTGYLNSGSGPVFPRPAPHLNSRPGTVYGSLEFRRGQ